MKNMVPCKMCMKNFEYSPGFSGNARQFCDVCKDTVDEKELQRIEEEMITKNNRYLIGSAKRKDEYDPIDILVDGNMPEFNSDADRFVCAVEVSSFLRKQKGGFCGMEKHIAGFLEHIGSPHNVVTIKQWTLPMMEAASRNEYLSPVMLKIIKIAHPGAFVKSPDHPPQLIRHEAGWTCKPSYPRE